MTAQPADAKPPHYTRSDIARMTGASNSQVKDISTEVLKKKGTGTGNVIPYTADDALRTMVARELLRVGVQMGSIHSLFASLEQPRLPTAHPWAWLRSPEARLDGAALVLVLPPPLAPSTKTGAVYLTTAREAVKLLRQSKVTIVTIDVGALIAQLEQHTGTPYA